MKVIEDGVGTAWGQSPCTPHAPWDRLYTYSPFYVFHFTFVMAFSA